MAYTFNTLNAAIAAAATNSDILAIIGNIQADMAGSPSVYTPVQVRQVNAQLDQFSNAKTFFENFYFLNGGALLFTQFGALVPPNFSPPTAAPYLSYTALLSQVGTADPTVVVLNNTIGNIVWTYSTIGEYKAVLAGAFPSGKVVILTGEDLQNYAGVFAFKRATDDEIHAEAGYLGIASSALVINPADSAFESFPLEIRVYQ